MEVFFKYVKSYAVELRYRLLYLFIFAVIEIVILLIYWNETILFILEPLDNLLLKNNNSSVYYMSKARYISEDFTENKYIFLTRDHNYSNDLPYFEISISTMARIEKMIFMVFCTYLSIVGLPFIIYQISLLFIPMMYKHEVYLYKRYITYSVITAYAVLAFSIKYSLPIALKSITLTTEEISNYEFEVEFDIDMYINIYFAIITTHILPIILVAFSLFLKCNWAILSLLFLCAYTFSSIKMSLVMCCAFVYYTIHFIIELNRYIQLVMTLVRYRYHITLNR